jgi:TerC family integral membrane protein
LGRARIAQRPRPFAAQSERKGFFFFALGLTEVYLAQRNKVMAELFPLSEYWWFYLAFVGLVILLLAVDLGIFHRKAHAVGFREAATWSAIWIGLSLLFNFLLYQYALWKFPQDPRLMAMPGFDPNVAAWRVSLEFLTGYVIEKSLSVDNIFVFVMVFSYFAIPAKYQHRVLFYGILGALVFRAIFVAMGAALMRYHWVVIFFGLFLIFTGIKIFFSKEKEVNPEKNLLIRLLRRLIPVTHDLQGPHFFTKLNGRYYATPLLIGLVFLEATDIIFAVDSVPAIFALTSEPLIVFTSNIFAILGLRALFFMLAGAVDKFYLLKFGLGVVLVFVGLKMVWLNQLFDGKFPIGISLGIIAGVLALSIVLSLVFPRKDAEVGSSEPPPGELESFKRHESPAKKYHISMVANRRLSNSAVRFLWKVVSIYLLLVGLALILGAALSGGQF